MLTALLALCTSMLMTAPPSTAHLAVPDSADSTEHAVASSPLQLRTHMNGWGAWIGGSLHASTLIAKTEGARFGLAGLQFGRVLATEDDMAVRFTTDLIPVAVLTYPKPPPSEGATPADVISPPSLSAYGVGVVPVGLQFVYRADYAVQPYFGGSGGLMYFPDPIPDGRGRKLNYTFDIGVGLRWVLGEHRVLTVGYRFHHLSNGFRGEINPGFDANIIFIGLSTM